jgi:hypothetical protein
LELRANTHRWLCATDPGAREVRMSCGAGLLNMRLAMRLAMATAGRRPVVGLMPEPADLAILATVRPGRHAPPTPEEVALHAVIPLRHSHRSPFRHEPVAPLHRHLLRRAAEREGAWVHAVDGPGEQNRLHDLLVAADRLQRADAGFRRSGTCGRGVRTASRWVFRPAAVGSPRSQPQMDGARLHARWRPRIDG